MRMNRKKKLLLNTSISLLYEVIVLICGFILPRFFLTNYGSAVNGLVSSITQFLAFISLADMGVGAVIQSTLYKSLAENNQTEISKVVLSSEKFFKRIAILLVCYVFVLMLIYPFVVADSFDYLYTMVLVAVMAISTFAQYYIGMTYKLLLAADQLGFVQQIIHMIAVTINTVSCILLMINGVPVHVVKLVTSLIFAIQPLILAYIAKRKYQIDRTIELTEEPIKQKWNGVTQHIASVVLGNTDTVVLTLLSTLENVSIYAVYHLVVNGVKNLVVSLSNGMRPMLGNMLYRKEFIKLNKTFELYECAMHYVVTVVFGSTALLILPFVMVYTKGVSDTDYVVPLFAFLITIANALICVRLPYFTMVLAAGHYKQTQWSAIIEAIINIVVSVLWVIPFGLSGVAIGTAVAILYRTFYFVVYLSKNILCRHVRHFTKHIFVDIIGICVLVLTVKYLPVFFNMNVYTYFEWIILAIKVAFIAIIEVFIVTLIFYRNLLLNGIKTIMNRSASHTTHPT